MVTLQKAIELAQIDYCLDGPVQQDPEYVAYKETWDELGGWSDGADVQGVRREIADARRRGRKEWDNAWRRHTTAIWNREMAVYDQRFQEWKDTILQTPETIDDALKTVCIMQVGYAANDFPSPHHAGSIYDHGGAAEELVNLNKAGFLTMGGQAASGRRREVQLDTDQRAYLEGVIHVSLLPYFCDELDRKYTLFYTQGGDNKATRRGTDGEAGEYISASIKIGPRWWRCDWHYHLETADIWDDVPGLADALNKKTAVLMIVAPWEEHQLWGDVMSALLRAYARREAEGRREPRGIKFTRTRIAPQVVRFRPF